MLVTITGTTSPSTDIEFVCIENSADLLAGVEYAIITEANGSYNFQLETGRFDVKVGNRQYRNITINANGSLNDFLGDANGCNL